MVERRKRKQEERVCQRERERERNGRAETERGLLARVSGVLAEPPSTSHHGPDETVPEGVLGKPRTANRNGGLKGTAAHPAAHAPKPTFQND